MQIINPSHLRSHRLCSAHRRGSGLRRGHLCNASTTSPAPAPGPEPTPASRASGPSSSGNQVAIVMSTVHMGLTCVQGAVMFNMNNNMNKAAEDTSRKLDKLADHTSRKLEKLTDKVDALVEAVAAMRGTRILQTGLNH
ncbi:hypothetical protein HYH03_012778 [Edaphochlamys debaryana]|uniref:Uncharacterized protein n=1 Tax=Edaphochlamys debaryana TaxID=47281 RepID=A0A835XUY3_9CHLO|nr:hypothetical protein HYH03_012778 [Edaphochlamys debaryana]|eukprot:KAG2488781.1 hypothetical protein HYH03_012778 [Edaphochlamys debaryana]